MLACVCQPAETKLYKGGRATPLGPLGGPRRPLQRPRGVKSRPPKPPPKPSPPTTSSDDTPKTSSSLSLRRVERRSKTTRIPSVQGDDCGGVVTITDNDGRIYCVDPDRLILVAEDVLKARLNDDDKWPSTTTTTTGAKLTVKQKTEECGEGATSDARGPQEAAATGGTNATELPEGVELTLGELRAMALRQQQQIDCQHQLLAAREQRLRFLKQQEARHHQVAAENERLRRLRERVEAQELKLRRLRALRGQLDQTNLNNVALTSDLESIRALFNEKEKELSVAVAKVEELTRQLEEVRRGRAPPRGQPPAALELDKLRRELMYRNKLNEQQNARLSQQREALTARQAEMASIDQRISELQGRLQRKRVANRQLAAQITTKHLAPRSNSAVPVQLTNYQNPCTGLSASTKNQAPRGNIAAVEPYNHIPHAPSLNHAHNFQALKHNAVQSSMPMKHLTQPDPIGNHIGQQQQQQEVHYLQQKQFGNQVPYNGMYQQQRMPPNPDPNQFANQQQYHADHQNIKEHINNNNNIPAQLNKQRPSNEQEFLPEFAASKSDPKYQTLPYNTKFTANGPTKPPSSEAPPSGGIVKAPSSSNVNGGSVGSNLNHMTAHSTPLTVISKGLATPLTQNEPSETNGAYHLQKSDSTNKCDEKENIAHHIPANEQMKLSLVGQYKLQSAIGGRADLVRAFAPQATTQSKPVSSVAPTSVQVPPGKPSPIYQTSSTKIQPVQPQTISQSLHQQQQYQKSSGIPVIQHQISNNSSQSLLLSPPQSSSTPLSSTPDNDKNIPKPALPPKPNSKTTSNESSPNSDSVKSSDVSPLLENYKDTESTLPSIQQSNSTSSLDSQQMIIKAKPLTIRKQPLSEQPKLKSQSQITNKNGINVATTRRIEMPAAYLYNDLNQNGNDNSDLQKNDKLNNNTTKQLSISTSSSNDTTDRGTLSTESSETSSEDQSDKVISDQIGSVDLNGTSENGAVVFRRIKKGNLKQTGRANLSKRVSFDPLALLLDASLEGELELVQKTATQVPNASAANDEGITALHNAICAGHFEIVKFLVEFGCDVNAQDSDGWTPLHCAASCNNVAMVRFLVENGACIFATTLSDHETAAQKCEEDEEGFDGCSEYLYSVQEKLGIMNGGAVYAVFPYKAHENDELSFSPGARLSVVRKGDDAEREWWWARAPNGQEGYVPRNLLGLYPRVTPKSEQ